MGSGFAAFLVLCVHRVVIPLGDVEWFLILLLRLPSPTDMVKNIRLRCEP